MEHSLSGSPHNRLRTLACALALITSSCLPATAGAEMVKLQFKPAAAAAPAPNDLTPIAPTDAAWNVPPFVAPGNVIGNTITRAGDPAGTTTDYVEYARTVPQGLEPAGPIRGDLLVDLDKVEPGLPAVVVIHGGLVANAPCSEYRRITQTTWARKFTAAGYIVFMPDFLQPTNDKVSSPLAKILNLTKGKIPGDCMPDDGWEPGAEKAQITLQLAVRSLKQQLALFAQAHPGLPAAQAFAQASDKVVAFGGSSGGHMAARLALRSEDSSGAPGDSAALWKQRRVAASVGIGAIGECTVHNGVRNQSKLYGIASFDPKVPKPFAGCGPVLPDDHDSPIKFFTSAIQYFWFGHWKTMPSPLGGGSGWGPNLGWDGVGDPRWPKRTCEDLNAFKPGSCTSQVFPIADERAHYNFPLNARKPGTPKDSPKYWDSTVFPQIDAFFRSAKSDAQVP